MRTTHSEMLMALSKKLLKVIQQVKRGFGVIPA